MVRKLMKFVFVLLAIFLLNARVLEAEEIPQFYQVICQEPNGNNGYYRIEPEVMIRHSDGNLITRYQIFFPSGKKVTGKIAGAGENAIILATVFEEGEHQLDVWMEETNGKVVSGTEQTKKIKIDRTGPDKAIQFTIDKEKGNVIEIEAEDPVSGVEGIYYKLGNGEVQYLKGMHVYVSVPTQFKGKITAYAVDKAGNIGTAWESGEMDGSHIESSASGNTKSVISNSVSIDNSASEEQTKPELLLEGIDNYMITGSNVQFSCRVTDDNGIFSLKGEIVWEDVDGNEKTMEVTDWSKEGEAYIFRSELNEDGIYRISFQATDQSGNQCEEKRHIIIDKTNPVIKMVQELDGAEIESFQWDYDMDEIVSDFSSYTYEVRLDGVLCNEKKIYSKAGKHAVEVLVTDAAGNQARAVAEFRIVKEQEKQSSYVWKCLLLILVLIILGSVGKVLMIKRRVFKRYTAKKKNFTKIST